MWFGTEPFVVVKDIAAIKVHSFLYIYSNTLSPLQSLFWHRNLNLEFGVPLCNVSKSSVNTYVVWNRAICLVKDLAVIKVHSFCTFY